MKKIVLASSNKGKLREIQAVILDPSIELLYQTDLGVKDAKETGQTFVENAIIKARNACATTGLPSIADDSGLVVPALGGDPGIYSARWAGPNKDFRSAMQKVEDGLLSEKDRSAHFVSALTLAWPDGHTESVEGKVQGELVWPPRGDRGFGYDPVFVAAGNDMTFGEMDPAVKHKISHRADAFRKLVDLCFSS